LIGKEEEICTACLYHIPRTNFHLQKENAIEKRFCGKANIERATAFFFFQKGSDFRELLHLLKYKGEQQIGVVLGKFAALQKTKNIKISIFTLAVA
jgi:predicted amidophosphoribosyltransferase